MHPRSIYYNGPTDFAQLAKDCPSLSKYLRGGSNINFKDPDAIRELTKSLLIRDFGLDVELPEDRLCPTVPNRLNYILWIQDLLDSTGHPGKDVYDPSRKVVGLDVGTGASCIYPLLGCVQRESWSFVGTDIDEESLRCAKENVRRNLGRLGGKDRIVIFENSPKAEIFPISQLGLDRLDFTMCNPPFYASIEDMFESAKQKSLPPSSACTGTTTEMVHEPGGEVAFVRRMFQESILLKFDPKFTNTWFTSMLGKHSSVETLVSEIRLLSQNYAITEFKQGLTRRWGIAWSWGDRRPGLNVARYDSSQLKSSMPFPPEFRVEIRGCSVEAAGEMIDDLFGRDLSLKEWEWDQDEAVGWGNATGNVWSRAARRALARNQGGEKEDAAVALGFRISVRARDDEDDVVGVLVRWTRGTDPVLFESFCGMLKRKISQSFGA